MTDPAAMAAADEISQQVALLSAGILEAVLQTDAVTGETSTLEDALSNFSTSYASAGGLVTNDTTASEGTIVSLDDILAETSHVVDQVESDAIEADVDLNIDSVSTLIDVQLADAQNEEQSDDADTSIEPIDTVLADRVTQAKALISDLRDLGTVVNLSSIESATQTFGSDIEAAFSDTEMVGEISDDAAEVAQVLALATEAIAEAFSAYAEDDSLTSYTLPANIDDDIPAVNVSIAPAQGDDDINIILSVDQDISGVTTEITATTNYSRDESETVSTEVAYSELLEFAYNAVVSLSGSASNDAFSLSINDGSGIDVSFEGEEVYNDNPNDVSGWEETELLEVSNLALDLDVTLSQTTGANPIAFNGTMELNLSGGVSTYSESFETISPDSNCNGYPCEGQKENAESLTFNEASLSLSGTFSDQQNNSLNASFSISLGNENGYTNLETFQVSWNYLSDPVIDINVQDFAPACKK